MEQGEYRKLNVELPVEPITDERPWIVAGWLLALVFLITSGYAYLGYKEYIKAPVVTNVGRDNNSGK